MQHMFYSSKYCKWKNYWALIAKTIMTSCNLKQLNFHPYKYPFTILDEKYAFLFYFFIQTCNSHKL